MKYFLLLLSLFVSNISFAQLQGQLGILDLTANGGNNPATGLPWVVGDTYRLVFLTSTTLDATSTNIADYNTHVQNAANVAGYGLTNWYAIGSTSTVDARDNTFTTGADPDGSIFLMDGSQVVANNIADLWDGEIDTRIDIDENGNPNSVTTAIWTTWTAVWTGTADNGTAKSTTFLGANIVTIGLAEAEPRFWEDRAFSSPSPNSNTLPMYGISEVLRIQFDASVPVELFSFELELLKDQNSVKLQWQTASEINNDHFTVERSADGNNWESIQQIDGFGNSSSLKAYQFMDYKPIQGVSYYRLKQTDFDGQFSYSPVKSINIQSQRGATILYPNPTTQEITIDGDQIEFGTLRIFNLQGQDVTQLVKINRSVDERVILDLFALPSGTYYVKTKTTTQTVYKQ